jgi:hypothetical protein
VRCDIYIYIYTHTYLYMCVSLGFRGLKDNVSNGLITKSLPNIRIHLLCSTELQGQVEALTDRHQAVYLYKFKAECRCTTMSLNKGTMK